MDNTYFNRGHIESVLYWMDEYISIHYACRKEQEDKYSIYSLIYMDKNSEEPAEALRWVCSFNEAADKMTELIIGN